MTEGITCLGISKSYGEGEFAEKVLHKVNLGLVRGQSAVLLGPSGSGKTTLLSILGCLLAPTHGDLLIDGLHIDFKDKASLIETRRSRIGFIFQHAQLLPFMTVQENLRVVGINAGLLEADLAVRIETLLERLGLSPMRNKYSGQLSGGQRQRVAIARALLHGPSIVLADEPTAALDWRHGKIVIELLLNQVAQENCVLIVVSHDTRMVPLFNRALLIDDGHVHEVDPNDVFSH